MSEYVGDYRHYSEYGFCAVTVTTDALQRCRWSDTSLQCTYIRFTVGNISMTESLLPRKTGIAGVMRVIKTSKLYRNYELENK